MASPLPDNEQQQPGCLPACTTRGTATTTTTTTTTS